MPEIGGGRATDGGGCKLFGLGGACGIGGGGGTAAGGAIGASAPRNVGVLVGGGALKPGGPAPGIGGGLAPGIGGGLSDGGPFCGGGTTCGPRSVGFSLLGGLIGAVEYAGVMPGGTSGSLPYAALAMPLSRGRP